MSKITEAYLKSLNTIAFKFSVDVPDLSGLTDEEIAAMFVLAEKFGRKHAVH